MVVISYILILFGSWVIGFNYLCVIRGFLGKDSESGVPLFGGVICAIGLFLNPKLELKAYSLLPLVIDLYALPYLAWCVVSSFKAKSSP